MTAPSIISDASALKVALEIKRRYHDLRHNPDFDALTAFVATGEITDPDGWKYHLNGALGPVARGRDALLAYVAHHGERGPVEGWSA